MNISIIIITRNEEKRIAECLQSICNQYIEDLFEILIVDGDSTDHTVDIVQEFQKRYKFISLIKCKKYGYGYQRNVGVLNASGDYALFLSGDTVVSKRLIYKYTCYLDSYDVIQGTVINVVDEVPFSQYIMEACYLLYHNHLYSMAEMFSTVNVCVKRDLLLSRRFDEKLIALEDKEWALDFEKSANCYRLKSGCVYHKVHDDFFQYGKKIYNEARSVGEILRKKRKREEKENTDFFEWYTYTTNFLVVLIIAILAFAFSVAQKNFCLSGLCFAIPIVYKIVYIISICIKGKLKLSVYSIIVAYHYYDCVFRGLIKGLII